ncbi:hypothetical protein QBC33DRAFT_622084 [Phialemonium atrogriseum]|uniref:WSC domain-containing protein n=1 Tax=Phialemonium atrogriseum TaxID=1093897 RepID=A0AAJ0BWJ3_9PEZI|nr:uncharacterized protein QBC33DRAFT_622084 [Phialemonium atrogriseum]KAK1764419.1 hypothetical protein QBC33DRAFT_622084 [Phialemonium atrogriseum]
MRSFVTYSLGLVAAASWTVAAFPSLEVRYADLAELQARQAPGTPEYQCHSDCGYAILGADDAGYCTNSTWLGLLDDCLECANKFNIWRYYGNGVTGAAKGCGLDAVPSPSGGEAPPSSTAAGPTSSGGGGAPETSAPATSSPPPAETTSAAGTSAGTSGGSTAEPSGPAESSSAAGSQSSAPEGSAAPTASSTGSGSAAGTGTIPSSSAPTSTYVTVSGGIRRQDIPSILAIGLSMLALAY